MITCSTDPLASSCTCNVAHVAIKPLSAAVTSSTVSPTLSTSVAFRKLTTRYLVSGSSPTPTCYYIHKLVNQKYSILSMYY
jgi:hypothetical protein